MQKIKALLLRAFGAFVCVCALAGAETSGLRQTDVFVSGENGYHTYRIPALIVTTNHTLLAFCEGRKSGRGDGGDIDLVLKRSTNGGISWSDTQVIWDDGVNTCGNPCPVVDEETGTIWLLMTHNLGGDKETQIKSGLAHQTRTVWVSQSVDDGRTWSKPEEITKSVKPPSWKWYATGPGVGIQLKHGPHKGRLVVPCDHSEEGTEHAAHAIYSDDHGKTWQSGGSIQPGMNECQVVELSEPPGALLMDMRSYRGNACRSESISTDGGVTWSGPKDVPELIEPICQASILRGAWPGQGAKSVILFSNPADTKKRKDMTVRLSADEGKTWPVSKVIHAGPAAYSCLAMLPDGRVGLLYEQGEKSASDKISLARFTLDWLGAP